MSLSFRVHRLPLGGAFNPWSFVGVGGCQSQYRAEKGEERPRQLSVVCPPSQLVVRSGSNRWEGALHVHRRPDDNIDLNRSSLGRWAREACESAGEQVQPPHPPRPAVLLDDAGRQPRGGRHELGPEGPGRLHAEFLRWRRYDLPAVGAHGCHAPARKDPPPPPHLARISRSVAPRKGWLKLTGLSTNRLINFRARVLNFS